MGAISVVGAVGLDIEKGRKVEECGERCFFSLLSFFLLKLRQGTRT